MATDPIQAVLFDMGGTLEELYYDDAVRLEASRSLLELLRRLELDPGLGAPELRATIARGMGRYQAWREETEIELPPERVWTDYLLPDRGLPRERLAAAAEELAFFYECHFYVRSLRPEAPACVQALCAQGLRLGVISNITSRSVVPTILEGYGLARCFDPVVSSAAFGRRKPSPEIFWEAARLVGVPPAGCAYVGDTISRDVVGARRAGYGLAIQIRSFLTEIADHPGNTGGKGGIVPDAVVRDLMEVLPVVWRGREARHGGQAR